jgi:hypothetical protein
VDIAERSLSESPLHGPTTAVQAIERIQDILRQLAPRFFPDGLCHDESGETRLVLPARSRDRLRAARNVALPNRKPTPRSSVRSRCNRCLGGRTRRDVCSVRPLLLRFFVAYAPRGRKSRRPIGLHVAAVADNFNTPRGGSMGRRVRLSGKSLAHATTNACGAPVLILVVNHFASTSSSAAHSVASPSKS